MDTSLSITLARGSKISTHPMAETVPFSWDCNCEHR